MSPIISFVFPYEYIQCCWSWQPGWSEMSERQMSIGPLSIISWAYQHPEITDKAINLLLSMIPRLHIQTLKLEMCAMPTLDNLLLPASIAQDPRMDY